MKRKRRRIGRRELKKQLDWLLSFAGSAKPTQRDLGQFLAFFFGESEWEEEVHLEYVDYIKQRLGQIQVEIKQYLEELVQQKPSAEWQPLPAFDRWSFAVSYGVYRKGDKLMVRPTLGQRIRLATTEMDDSLLGNLQYRLFSLLAHFQLSSIRNCPGCRGLYYATEMKKVDLCRKCQLRKGKRKWERKNRIALERQRAHLEGTGERLPISRFREE